MEQGRDLLQAAPTGFSAAVTHRGRLLSRSVLGARSVLTATLERRNGWTVYVRFGDLPPLAMAVLALLGGWWLAARRPSRLRRPPANRSPGRPANRSGRGSGYS